MGNQHHRIAAGEPPPQAAPAKAGEHLRALGPLWLIYSFEHMAWWRANHVGYTVRIEEAGHYSTPDAVAICLRANVVMKHGQPNEVMVLAPVWTGALEELFAGGVLIR